MRICVADYFYCSFDNGNYSEFNSFLLLLPAIFILMLLLFSNSIMCFEYTPKSHYKTTKRRAKETAKEEASNKFSWQVRHEAGCEEPNDTLIANACIYHNNADIIQTWVQMCGCSTIYVCKCVYIHIYIHMWISKWGPLWRCDHLKCNASILNENVTVKHIHTNICTHTYANIYSEKRNIAL